MCVFTWFGLSLRCQPHRFILKQHENTLQHTKKTLILMITQINFICKSLYYIILIILYYIIINKWSEINKVEKKNLDRFLFIILYYIK